MRLKHLVSTALEQTASLWLPLSLAYDWVHQAATLLDNMDQLDVEALQANFRQLLQEMRARKAEVGSLTSGIEHFLKVTQSYWSGLFHCYAIDGLPRTNNDLEQVFGQMRHHQRRVTGRKQAPASLVVRGSVRLIAMIATRTAPFTPQALASISIERWKAVRSDLQNHRHKRLQQRHFRRDPDSYLAQVEAKFLQSTLPR